MSGQRQQDIKATVVDVVNGFAARARVDAATLGDDTDLFVAGVIDSFGFFELIEQLEGRFGKKLDFEFFDDRDIGTIGGLMRQIAKLFAM